MISAIAFCCILNSAAPKREVISAGQVISKMLARYSGLQSLTGQITLTVTADASTGKATREYDTDVQFERPSKVYISQVQRDPIRRWLVTSDGTIFTHDVPETTQSSRGHRMIEQVSFSVTSKDAQNGQPVTKTITNDVTQIYAACCTSIHDRSVPLGIAFCWTDELRRFVNQWVDPVFVKSDADGTDDYVIQGGHRPFVMDPPAPVNGTFTMHISKTFDLLDYSVAELEAVPGKPGITVSVVLDWKVNLTPNGKPDERLFTVVK